VITYTLNLADISNNTITNTDREVTLTKEANLTENPIFISNILETGGKKIGYLMYNGFTNEFDEQLNDVFWRVQVIWRNGFSIGFKVQSRRFGQFGSIIIEHDLRNFYQ